MPPYKDAVILIFLTLCLAFGPVTNNVTPPQPTASLSENPAYVDPSLVAVESGALSVIVTGADSVSAAQAVAAVGGSVTSDLWIINGVAAQIPTAILRKLAQTEGVESIIANHGVAAAQTPIPDGSDVQGWVTDFRFPVPWNGTPDVVAVGVNQQLWKFVYPTTIDVGSDVLYQGNGYPTTRGSGVTVAVVDSGVFFSNKMPKSLDESKKNFRGQVDFVGSGVCPSGLINGHSQQFVGYCWTDDRMSYDGYGHGTHVAGIIWNRAEDANTHQILGIAPDVNIVSVRVLDNSGQGTYEDVIQGIQWLVANKAVHSIRIINLSLSAQATVPYFVDPLNRAVEAAWAAGIVVLAAAGNDGPAAQTISVPGNDPYIITVGSVTGERTPGYWSDDHLSTWSATGPTLDGFVKPDVLAPGAQIVSFMHNDDSDINKSAYLVRNHPDYTLNSDFFRMNGTSMATAVASGVVALMLQAKPDLTPDQVKYRLMRTARPSITQKDGATVPVNNILQQGAGRIWAPDAVYANLPLESANVGLNITDDLAHDFWTTWIDSNGNGLVDEAEVNQLAISHHYQGSVQRKLSDDGQAYLYYLTDLNGKLFALGAAEAATMAWLDRDVMDSMNLTWDDGTLYWPAGSLTSSGGYAWGGGGYAWGGGGYAWGGGGYAWGGGGYAWGGGGYAWGGGGYAWGGGGYAWGGGGYAWGGGGYAWGGGGYAWGGGGYAWGGGGYAWSGLSTGSTRWVNDEGAIAARSATTNSKPIPEIVQVVAPLYLPLVTH